MQQSNGCIDTCAMPQWQWCDCTEYDPYNCCFNQFSTFNQSPLAAPTVAPQSVAPQSKPFVGGSGVVGVGVGVGVGVVGVGVGVVGVGVGVGVVELVLITYHV